MRVSREAESRKSAKMHTKDGGRVLVWHTSKEPERISLAVPGDRATLTREEALEVASELATAAQALPSRMTVSHPPMQARPFGGFATPADAAKLYGGR